jgi:RNA polymerase sigma factor (sigma-70 family)
LRSQLNTEQELLGALASGQREATEKIYLQYYPVITKWIGSRGGEESDAADIYQEAMIVLYEKAQNEDFRLTCKIGTYLFAISKHLWYKKLQKTQATPVTSSEDMGDIMYIDDVKAHKERENHYRQLDNALEQLGEPCKSLIKAFYHQDKSMQEIAMDFGYTNPANAKTQKYKCLNRLKKLFFDVQVK